MDRKIISPELQAHIDKLQSRPRFAFRANAECASAGWYMLLLRADRMKLAHDLLKAFHIKTYLPQSRSYGHKGAYSRKLRKDRKPIYKPKLPGYLPVQMLNARHWVALMAMRLDWHILAKDGWPLLLDDEFLADQICAKFIDESGEATDIRALMETGAEFGEGETVMLSDSAYEALKCHVVEISGETTRVMAEMFGAEMEMTVATRDLRKA